MFDKQRHAKDLDGSSGGIINKQNRGARDQRLYRLKFFFPVVMVVCLLGEYTNLHKTPGQYSKSFFSPAKIFSIFFFEERSKSGLQCSKSSRERLLCSHFFFARKNIAQRIISLEKKRVQFHLDGKAVRRLKKGTKCKAWKLRPCCVEKEKGLR